MKIGNRRLVGLAAAAILTPFAVMGSYLVATQGGRLHSAPLVALLFLSIGLGIGCILLWALPLRSVTKIALVLPYILVVGGAAFFFGFWLVARATGVGP